MIFRHSTVLKNFFFNIRKYHSIFDKIIRTNFIFDQTSDVFLSISFYEFIDIRSCDLTIVIIVYQSTVKY